jgi:ABC-2 type transport system permease protein
MNIHRAFAITKRIFRGLRHDRRTVALMFLAPIVAMCVFGLAFSGDVKDVNVVVVNLDDAPVSVSGVIISNFDKEVLKVAYVASVEEGVRRVEDGKAYAVIIFPEHFTESLLMKRQNPSYEGDTTIQVREDRSNVNVANAITKSISETILKTAQEAGQDLPMKVDAEDAIYGKGAKFMDFFVPGLPSPPLRDTELVVGYAIAFSIIGMLQTVVLLVIGTVAFDIMIVGNVVLAFAIIALLAVVSLSLGILLSSLAKREAQAIQFFPLIVLPTFLLAGIFWPVEAIPQWLRPLSYLIPPSYAVDATRSVMLRGWGIGEIWVDIAALCGFAAAFLTVAILSLKRGRR